MKLKFWEKNQIGRKLIAYIFTTDHQFIFREVITNPEDDNQTFVYLDKPYIYDESAIQFYREKKPVLFYILNVPNPIKFDFTRYMKKFIEQKRLNPQQNVFDDNNNLLDLTFTSDALQKYKDDKFLKQLLTVSPEQLKMIYMLIGALGLSFIAIIMIVFFLRK